MLSREDADRERARIARNAINRITPVLWALHEANQRGEIKSGGAFISPVRAAVAQAFDDVGRKEDNREEVYGILKGAYSILTLVRPATPLHDALVEVLDLVAAIIITDSPAWIEAQDERINHLVRDLKDAGDLKVQAA